MPDAIVLDRKGLFEPYSPSVQEVLTANVKRKLELIGREIKSMSPKYREMVSDGYHTFDELYEQRKVLIALAFRQLKGWRAPFHNDGTMYKDMFIVGAEVIIEGQTFQVSYHINIKDWDLFSGIMTYEHAPVAWDGHTSSDVIGILRRYLHG